MTSALQLQAACRDVPGFLGVFAADRLPEKIGRLHKESLIVNYDDAGEPGSHWCAIIFTRGGAARWFDSFGAPPDGEDTILNRKTTFRDYLARHARGWTYNTLDLQCLAENTCGEWSATAVRIGALPQEDPRAWRRLLDQPRCRADKRVIELVGIRG